MSHRKKHHPVLVVEGNLPSIIHGHIAVTITGIIDGKPQLTLDGGSDEVGWSAEGETIKLMPTTEQETNTALWYKLILKLTEPTEFRMVGIQILHHRLDKPSTEHAAILIPPSTDGLQTELNLLHQISTTDELVTYGMFIGLFKDNQTFWHDPTIAFDPPTGPDPVP
jgi:hypothetical protein